MIRGFLIQGNPLIYLDIIETELICEKESFYMPEYFSIHLFMIYLATLPDVFPCIRLSTSSTVTWLKSP